ncbi:roadblock/LC7 domain-containing protein [Actinomadura graeca]|uniref:Roadblock/LC7 domain-containing protein n=1 Tax=Actinomadura graeca TaxID=2750812 RepID=A0ABX8R4T3_9ACTN|nr:roadblock/LC7 domain-containing protein [Actinomadura graeca]QXJ25848.1 roadblock/LC7 domain-containing protein [Actinomadura graeca]
MTTPPPPARPPAASPAGSPAGLPDAPPAAPAALPAAPAALPAEPAAAAAGGVPGPGGDLGWLLGELLTRVPAIEAALLVSRDGLRLAAAGMSDDDADIAAAAAASLCSVAGATGRINRRPGGSLRMVLVQHDAGWTFVMGTPGQQGLAAAPGEPDTVPEAAPELVGCALAVLAAPDADPGVIGHEMSALTRAVAEHLLIATRATGTDTGTGTGTGAGSGHGGGRP